MKKLNLALCLMGALIYLPLNAAAVMDDSQARADVEILLNEGKSAGDIISALQADGRELLEACVVATVASSEEDQLAFVRTCITSARTVEEARSIADALIAAAGEDTPLALTVAGVMNTYNTQTLPVPASYQGDGIATGGSSVSPST
ncbi:MAG: hypothetical protein ACI9DH_001851 [Halioglobus sp.]|jgi:hypothetical protein